jgi:hypothetical protein
MGRMHLPVVAGSDLIGPEPSRSSELLLHAVQRMADEQSGVRTVREQREKRRCGWWRLPSKIEHLPVRPPLASIKPHRKALLGSRPGPHSVAYRPGRLLD